jgi:hypothetical protein
MAQKGLRTTNSQFLSLVPSSVLFFIRLIAEPELFIEEEKGTTRLSMTTVASAKNRGVV